MSNAIKSVKFYPINIKASNWSQNTVVVKVEDESGRYGIGEADGSPDVIKAYSDLETEHKWLTNLADPIIGGDPMEFFANYDRMYDMNRWVGMRGLGLFALSGIDMALYDLAGKQHNLPVYKLLGGQVREKSFPYYTLYPSVAADAPMRETIDAYAPILEHAQKQQVKAAKVCVMPEANLSNRQVVEYLKELRNILGYDIDMMCDFLYSFKDWQDARWVLSKIEDVDLYFAEAMLDHDDLEGHRKLAAAVDTRICGAEMATTRFEVMQWIEQTGVSVVQPDYNRCGGLTELRRIVELARMKNVQVSPHNWKTGITAAASRHFHFACDCVKYVEYLSPEFYDGSLRRELVTPEAPMIEGGFELPTEPGLGIDINRDFFSEVTGLEF